MSSDTPAAPDYSPVADASKESAQIMGKLGQDQLDFAKQQYEDAKPLFARVVAQQEDIATQTAAQGKDYYGYLKTYRPAERSMMYESMGLNAAETAQLEGTLATGNQADYDSQFSSLSGTAAARRTTELDAAKALDQTDAAVIGGSDAEVYAARKAQIDAGVGTAIADTQDGYTRSTNQAMREGLRYGSSASKVVGDVGGLGMAQASNVAAAANGARTAGINTERDLANTRMGLRSVITDNITKARSIDWAKKLDATGLAKGMPGASAGAYGLAINSGNSAGANQLAPGAQRQVGMVNGAQTIGAGRTLYQNGLGDILDSQTGVYNAGTAAGASNTGAALGAVGGIAAAVI